MRQLPDYVYWLFDLTAFFALLIFYYASSKSKIVLTIILLWLALQTTIALTGFYADSYTIPPKFLLLIVPPLILILGLFTSQKGKLFIDRFHLKTLTLLHMVRIPVEIILYWLFMHKAIPGLMTFEGRNFDIFSGLTAPLIWYFGFVKNKLNRSVVLLWNMVCLGLLLNIVINAVLSVHTPFQQFAFDQPNVAILYLPFIFLPGFLVPLVLFSHLVAVRQLTTTNRMTD